MIELEMQDRMELVREAQDVVKSRYLLCILVTQRIHQLENGALPTIDVDPEELTNPKIFLALRICLALHLKPSQITKLLECCIFLITLMTTKDIP